MISFEFREMLALFREIVIIISQNRVCNERNEAFKHSVTIPVTKNKIVFRSSERLRHFIKKANKAKTGGLKQFAKYSLK